MNQKSKIALGAVCAFFCGFSSLNAVAQAPALPDGKGKAEFVHNCTACHRAEMITKVRKTPEDWRKTVDDMAARGVDGTKQDMDNVVLYLNANYGADKPGLVAPTPSATPSSTAAAPAAPTASPSDRAKHTIAENGCLSCHRIEQQGGYTAPSLNGVSGRLSASEIRSAILSPIPTLSPGNTLVRLTTPDGKTLTGRLLSHDEQEVRVMDASGEVNTYTKSELSQFTVIDTNPMPSFETKIKGDDLDNLVHYLAALPPVSDSAQK